MARENWFKDGNKETVSAEGWKRGKKPSSRQEETGRIPTTTVMFVPSTKGGLLARMLKESEMEMARITKFRMKIQESGGIQLARLFSTDLARGKHCGREDCQPCGMSEESKTNCKQQNVLYESRCGLCNKEEDVKRSSQKEEEAPRRGIYLGETSRTLYERSKEHVADAVSFKEGSHIIKHWISSHHEDKKRPPFFFKVLQPFKDCLSRQVAEAVAINYSKDELLNSKNEYNSNCLSRLVVDEDRYERKKREKDEEMKEADEKTQWESFRLSHKRTEKRQRDANQQTIPDGWREPGQRSAKIMRMEVVQPSGRATENSDFFDLTRWWADSEGRCIRAGNLNRLLTYNKQRVLRRMSTLAQDNLYMDVKKWMVNALIWAGWKEDQLGGVGWQQAGAEDSYKELTEPAATVPHESSPQADMSNHNKNKKTKAWSDHLTGLVGWWRRLESNQEKEEMKLKKFVITKTDEIRNRNLAENSKFTFLKRWKMAVSSNDIVKANRLENLDSSFIHSPKRKAGGGGVISADNIILNSPSKKARKVFKQRILFWENESEITQNRMEDNGTGGDSLGLKDG